MPSAPVVILTQEAEDSAAVAAELAALGVASLVYPCIATQYLPFDPSLPVAGRSLGDYRLLAFTSKRGARGAVPAREVFARSAPLVACVGAGTAREVEHQLGLSCSILPPSETTGAGLAQAIIEACGAPLALLHIRGDLSTGTFRETLVVAGWEVAELMVYQNYEPELQPLYSTGLTVVVLASPSAASRFFAAHPDLVERATCVVIGAVTANHVQQLGVKKVVIAENPCLAGLVAAVRQVLPQSEVDEP